MRLLRVGLRARAYAAHANGRTEAAQALWSVHDDVSGLLDLLAQEQPLRPVDMTAADTEAREDTRP
jgi:hypothetical protein